MQVSIAGATNGSRSRAGVAMHCGRITLCAFATALSSESSLLKPEFETTGVARNNSPAKPDKFPPVPHTGAYNRGCYQGDAMQRESYERAEAQANAVVASTNSTDQPHVWQLAQAVATLAAALKEDLARIERRLDRLEVVARGRP